MWIRFAFMAHTQNSRMLRTFGAVACLFILSFATACGSDSDKAGDEAATANQTSVEVNHDPLPEGTGPASLILNGDNTPAGYTHEPTSAESQGATQDIFGDTIDEDRPTTVPEQCSGAVVDGTTFLDWLFQPAETTAVTSFTRTDNKDAAVHVMASTQPADPSQYPKDVAECATTTKTSDRSDWATAKEFEVSPVDLNVQGADTLVAAQTKLVSNKLNGEEVGEGGETLYVYAGSVRGAHFIIASTTTMTAEEFSDLATAQAKKISEAS